MVTVGFARPPGGGAPEAESVRINADDPLFVINGVIATAAEFNRLSPAAIESISILKEGSSTARYSDPRARNGVVLITTKPAAD